MIVLAYDHGAWEKFEIVKSLLDGRGIEYEVFASKEYDALDSFAVFAREANEKVKSGAVGIYGCRSGIGMSMASNKARGVRGALCFNEKIAEMSRLHNNSNVCILPCDYITDDDVVSIVEKFLATDFLGGKYQARIDELEEIK